MDHKVNLHGRRINLELFDDKSSDEYPIAQHQIATYRNIEGFGELSLEDRVLKLRNTERAEERRSASE
jgi:hypothetical protein